MLKMVDVGMLVNIWQLELTALKAMNIQKRILIGGKITGGDAVLVTV